MFETILEVVSSASTQPVVVDENATPKAIKILSTDLVSVCKALYTHEKTYFDMLSCITAIDNGPDAGTIEIAYNLYSIPYNLHLMLKTSLSRDAAEIDSLSSIWKTADWHEREVYDMFGIVFKGHPDLRRILLPADWKGHPLRKDYEHEEYYKGIKVDY